MSRNQALGAVLVLLVVVGGIFLLIALLGSETTVGSEQGAGLTSHVGSITREVGVVSPAEA